MHRGFERDEYRRRYRDDDDPRDDPRERYGNEEDPWSRAYRRTYAEEDLPRRMHDDRPGYEPELGRPGARENVDLDRGRRERRFGASDSRRGDDRWQGGYYGQGQRFEGDPFRGQRETGRAYPTGGASRHSESSGRGPLYGQPAYSGPASPYDQGEIGAWYGGDTGMGDPGSSQLGSQTGERYGVQSGGQWERRSERRSGGPSTRDSGDRWGQPTGRSFERPSGEEQHFDRGGGRLWGPFAGRGPRGYERSDDRIREDVCELSTEHGEIDASDMEVEVRGGVLVLRGVADSGWARRLAEELVEQLPGVRDVQNELRVRRRMGAGQGDAEPMVDTGVFAADRGGLRESGVPDCGVGVASTSGVSTRSGPGEPGTGAGAGPSQRGNRWPIREATDIVGSDGETIGTVKAVHGTDFYLERPGGAISSCRSAPCGLLTASG